MFMIGCEMFRCFILVISWGSVVFDDDVDRMSRNSWLR